MFCSLNCLGIDVCFFVYFRIIFCFQFDSDLVVVLGSKNIRAIQLFMNYDLVSNQLSWFGLVQITVLETDIIFGSIQEQDMKFSILILIQVTTFLVVRKKILRTYMGNIWFCIFLMFCRVHQRDQQNLYDSVIILLRRSKLTLIKRKVKIHHLTKK